MLKNCQKINHNDKTFSRRSKLVKTTRRLKHVFLNIDNEKLKVENYLSIGGQCRSMIQWEAMSMLCSLTDFSGQDIVH